MPAAALDAALDPGTPEDSCLESAAGPAATQSNAICRWRGGLDILAAAVCIALATGLIEGLYWLIKQRVFHALICLNPEVWWMSPVFQLALVAVPCAALMVAAWCRPRWDVVPFAVTSFALVGWLDLVLLVPSLHFWAWILASCGLATASGRLFQRHRSRCLTIMRRAAAPALALLLIAAVLKNVAQRQHEAAKVAALPKPPAGAPNVLLIVLDAVRADALEIYGADHEVAPHIAALASQGVTFDHAWSTAAWTLPSQAGMFTGRLPSDVSADWLAALDASHPTLADTLSKHGWQTGGFVGNRRYCSAETGLARGFSHYEDYRLTALEFAMCTALGRNYLLSSLSVDCGLQNWPGRKRADEVGAGLLRWLPQRGERPYFAFLNLYDAHDPYVAPPAYRQHTPATRNDLLLMMHWWWLPKEELTGDQVGMLRGAYEDCIRGLDAEIGQLLDELKRRGELENTIIVLTSDHGEHFGDHELFLHGNSLYEPLIHVPLLVVWPGKVPAGQRVATPVSLSGLPNTILEMTGAHGDFPGRSWAACWSPAGPTAGESEIIAAEIVSQCGHPPCHGHSPIAHGPMQCVRQGNLKYIHGAGGSEELYDLERDPLELDNLADDSRQRPNLVHMRGLCERVHGGRTSWATFPPLSQASGSGGGR